jgi:Uncharacterised protein family (UPF0175)
MTITLDIPDELARALGVQGQDVSRAALEALALDGYRNDRLTEADLRQLLGFETRMEVHAFLKEHGAFLPYTAEDLEHDRQSALEAAQRAQAARDGAPEGGQRAG